jgi:hypothetical protein
MSSHNNKPFDPSKPVVVSGPLVSTSPSSRNALRHGSCAETLILKTENPQDYASLEANWFKTYKPTDESERHLVQELVNADWFLQRATRNVAEVEARLFEANPDQLNWTEEQHRSLTRFLRYQTTRANNFKRCQKAVEQFRKDRAAEKLAAVKLDTAKNHLRVFIENNGSGEPWKDQLAKMRQKAIELGHIPPDPKP